MLSTTTIVDDHDRHLTDLEAVLPWVRPCFTRETLGLQSCCNSADSIGECVLVSEAVKKFQYCTVVDASSKVLCNAEWFSSCLCLKLCG